MDVPRERIVLLEARVVVGNISREGGRAEGEREKEERREVKSQHRRSSSSTYLNLKRPPLQVKG